MDKFIELLIGEAFKHGLRKLFGYKPEKKGNGCLGCLGFLLFVGSYIVGIYYVSPMIKPESDWHVLIYVWPLIFPFVYFILYLAW